MEGSGRTDGGKRADGWREAGGRMEGSGRKARASVAYGHVAVWQCRCGQALKRGWDLYCVPTRTIPAPYTSPHLPPRSGSSTPAARSSGTRAPAWTRHGGSCSRWGRCVRVRVCEGACEGACVCVYVCVCVWLHQGGCGHRCH